MNQSSLARSRSALLASTDHLAHAARLLAGAPPDYREVLRHTLQTLRQAYTALLTAHHLPVHPEAPLDALAAPAVRLASMLYTYRRRALPLEPLQAALDGGGALTVATREAVEEGYYTARNTLGVVIGSLPEPVTRDADRALQCTEAAGLGRARPAPEAPRPIASPAPVRRTPAQAEGAGAAGRSHPLVTA